MEGVRALLFLVLLAGVGAAAWYGGREAVRRRAARDAAVSGQWAQELVRQLAHELRNPLAALANALRLVRQGTRTEEALALAERQVKRLGGLLDDVLDAGRIARGELALAREVVSLSDVVEQAVQATGPLVVERRHELTVTLPSGPLYVVGDRGRLEQVLRTLVDTAARHADGSGHITVRAQPAGERVEVRVAVSGTAFSPADLPRLFDVTGQPDGGIELGLGVVRGLVELHGGTVEAEPAGGAFVVRLPLAGPTPASHEPPRPPVEARTGSGGRRVG